MGSPPGAVGDRAGSCTGDVHPVTLDQLRDLGADLDDVRRHLVAAARGERREGVEPLVEVEVAAADEARPVTVHHLIRPRVGQLDVEPPELVGTHDDRGREP